jgi:hypothetical protein
VVLWGLCFLYFSHVVWFLVLALVMSLYNFYLISFQLLGIADDKILSPAEQDYMLMEYNGMVRYVMFMCYWFVVCLYFASTEY